MKKTAVLLATAMLFGFGCGDEDDDAGNNGTAAAWTAGDYTLTVLDVQDNCFDGAMDIIVLPTGGERDFPSDITLPGPDGLPASIDVEFSAPFTSVTGVAVEAAGTTGLQTSGTGFTQSGVDITSDGGDCVADMNVTFQLTGSTDGNLTGSGELSITSATGADCPVVQDSYPCTVVSNLRAVKN